MSSNTGALATLRRLVDQARATLAPRTRLRIYRRMAGEPLAYFEQRIAAAEAGVDATSRSIPAMLVLTDDSPVATEA